eukprot:m.404562 g.404562  ORF g.404562 m.404562 type:complete len:60 (-) comp20126_c0_seq12:2041-2220(-)
MATPVVVLMNQKICGGKKKLANKKPVCFQQVLSKKKQKSTVADFEICERQACCTICCWH